MSYNAISRERNLLNKALESIGQIKLDPEIYGSLLIKLVEAHDIIVEVIAGLPARTNRRSK